MADRTNAEILRAAKGRIPSQREYVIGALAWNREGRQVEPTSPDAARYGPRGAIYAESGIRPKPYKELDRDHILYRLLDRAARELPHTPTGGGAYLGDHAHECQCLHQVDENISHAQALAAFDRAIELAEAEAA